MERITKTMRTFSKDFKKEKVLLIEQGKLKVSDICKIYQVSYTAVYRWIKLYSSIAITERVVIEKISEEKKNIELLKKIAALENVIGKQQVNLIYLESVIECGSDLLGEDLAKKFKSQQ